MDALHELAALEDSFVPRHIGPSEADIATMLRKLGVESLAALAAETVPADIRIAADRRRAANPGRPARLVAAPL